MCLSLYQQIYCCFFTRKDASEADGYYNDHFVMQHDLLRELAIYQSSLDPVETRKRLIVELGSNNFPNWWLEEKQQPLGARLLSISTGCYLYLSNLSVVYTHNKKFSPTANFSCHW